jgi:hypothetical protein
MDGDKPGLDVDQGIGSERVGPLLELNFPNAEAPGAIPLGALAARDAI